MDNNMTNIIETDFAISDELSHRLDRYKIKDYEFRRKMTEIQDQNETDNIIREILKEKAVDYQGKGYYDDSIIYYDRLATFIASEDDGDPYDALLALNRALLKKISRTGNTHVSIKICGEGGCPDCKKTNGRILTIKDAYSSNILPNKKCGFDLYQSGHSYCRCTYEPFTQGNLYKSKKKQPKIAVDTNYKNYFYGILFILLFMAIIFASYELYYLYLSFS